MSRKIRIFSSRSRLVQTLILRLASNAAKPRVISSADTEKPAMIPNTSDPVEARAPVWLGVGSGVSVWPGVGSGVGLGLGETDGVTYLTITTPSAPALAPAGVDPAPPPLPVFAVGARVGELLPPTVPPPTEL
jgi:hypothetical protein